MATVSTFEDGYTTGEEPDLDAYGPLHAAAEVAPSLVEALHDMGYETVVVREPSAVTMGEAVFGLLDTGAGGEVRLVHVVSHGGQHLARTTCT